MCELDGFKHKTLLDLNITTTIYILSQTIKTKYRGKFNPKTMGFQTSIKLNENDRTSDDFKYKYFNERFGLNLSREEINHKYKVIPTIWSLLN